MSKAAPLARFTCRPPAPLARGRSVGSRGTPLQRRAAVTIETAGDEQHQTSSDHVVHERRMSKTTIRAQETPLALDSAAPQIHHELPRSPREPFRR